MTSFVRCATPIIRNLRWLNCRIPCHFKATPKNRWIRRYSVTTYVSPYPCIHLVNIFSIIVTAYPRIHFDVHLRQHRKHTVCLFVVLKATEGRKALKGITAYPQNSMQGWHYGKGLIYYRPIFRLTKLAFLRARTIPRETIFYRLLKWAIPHEKWKINNY